MKSAQPKKRPPSRLKEENRVMAATASVLYRFLLGAMQQNRIAMTVRQLGTPDEVARLPQIIQTWRGAAARMQELSSADVGAADQIVIEEPPKEVSLRLREIAADPLFQASFSDVPTSFKVVEIDKLVAPQREVGLDYVATLRTRVPGKSAVHLIDFCVGSRAAPTDTKALQAAQNQMTFTSPSLDLRFLGGFPKRITEDDIKVAYQGGQPVAAVTLLVGFGAAPINAWLVGRRMILANGFHRLVALRSEGITHAPIVVRHVTNPEVEFPEPNFGLPRSYFLQNQRPVLVKDFFDPALTLEVRLRPRRKVLRITWVPEESIVPD